MNPIVRIWSRTIDRLLSMRSKALGFFQRSAGPMETSDQSSRREFFQTLIENATDFITILDQYGTVLYESPSVMRYLGHSERDLVGKNIFEFLHPEETRRSGNYSGRGQRRQVSPPILSADFSGATAHGGFSK